MERLQVNGVEEVKAIIKGLHGNDSLLYAATKAIGPKQLTEEEAKGYCPAGLFGEPTSQLRRYREGHRPGKTDSRCLHSRFPAVNQMDLDIKIFLLNCPGTPQDRIAKRLGLDQKTIHNHLGKMAALPNFLNGNLPLGFTVAQVVEKHGWPDPMVWSLALEGKTDHDRFKALGVWTSEELLKVPSGQSFQPISAGPKTEPKSGFLSPPIT